MIFFLKNANSQPMYMIVVTYQISATKPSYVQTFFPDKPPTRKLLTEIRINQYSVYDYGEISVAVKTNGFFL